MKKLLIWVLALLLAMPALAMGEAAGAIVKDETVYALLDASGAAQNVLVVSRIETPEAGEYVDYGAYEELTAMVSDAKPAIDGETITWTLPEDAAGFYSVGKPAGEAVALPVLLEIAYTLDGEPVAPDALAGQSGHVTLSLTVRPNESAEAAYREKYMAQIQVPLSLDVCANIEAPGATGALVGKTQTLSYMVLPGQQATFEIAFDAKDFSFSGVSMACAGMDLGGMLGVDVSELTSQAGELTEGARALADGAGALSGGMDTLGEGLNTLAESAGALSDGVAALESGLGQAMEAVPTLANGATELGAGMTALAQGATAYIDGAQTALTGVGALAQGMGALAAQGATLNEQASQAITSLTALVATMPKEQAAVVTAQLTALSEGLNAYVQGVGQAAAQTQVLADGAATLAESGETLKAGVSAQQSGFETFAAGMTEWLTQTQALPEAVSQLSQGASALAEGAQGAAQSVAALPEQVSTLAEGQKTLADGLEEAIALLADMPALTAEAQPIPSFVSPEHTVRSLQFVYTTEAISVPAPEAQAEEEAAPQSFWDRLIALF